MFSIVTSLLANLPIGITCMVFAILAGMLSLLGLARFERCNLLKKLCPENEVTGIMFGAISLIYSLVLAFVIVAVWGNYEDLNQTIEREADKLDGILIHSASLPDSVQAPIKTALHNYCNQVINKEWQMDHEPKMHNASAIPQLRLLLLKNTAQSTENEGIYSVLDDDLSSISDLRRSRLSHNRAHVPTLVWFTLKIGSVMVIVFSFFFEVSSPRVKKLYIFSLTVSIAISLFLVYALDHPFNHNMQMSNQPYVNVLHETRVNNTFSKP